MKATTIILLLAMATTMTAKERSGDAVFPEKTDLNLHRSEYILAPDSTDNDTSHTSLLQRLKENVQEKIDSLKPKAEEAMIKADSILSVRNAKITTDTFYVARPPETWTFRFKTDGFGDFMHLRATDMEGNAGNYYLTADPKVTLGVMANYRGISLSLSLSPSKILSDISDMMTAFNYYSNTFGIDATFEKVESFHGRTSLQAHSHKLHNTNMRQFNLMGYYVFNGKRFSLPAVFNSTWVQRRSAGSFFVQANFNTGRIKIGDNLDSEHSFASSLNRIDMNAFSLGAGYGYNLVAGKHWLLHATVQPSFMVWNNYKLHTTNSEGKEEVNKMATDRINFFVVGRIGAIYSWNKYFLGLTSVVQHSKCGKDNDFAMRDTQWQARAFFGWRIHTKLHERPKPKPNRRRSVRRSTTTTRTAATKTTTKPATTTKKTTTKQKKTTTQPAKKGWTPKLDFSIPKNN